MKDSTTVPNDDIPTQEEFIRDHFVHSLDKINYLTDALKRAEQDLQGLAHDNKAQPMLVWDMYKTLSEVLGTDVRDWNTALRNGGFYGAEIEFDDYDALMIFPSIKELGTIGAAYANRHGMLPRELKWPFTMDKFFKVVEGMHKKVMKHYYRK